MFYCLAEICDGSSGLIKFISLAQENPKGQIIASLEPHLCPTAATFRFNQGRQFFSWTCSKVGSTTLVIIKSFNLPMTMKMTRKQVVDFYGIMH